MTDLIFATSAADTSLKFVEETALVFVDDAEYEFVGGGAASTNGF